ncbi:MAG TPA: protein NosL [Gammaproteobacteria bacterium]|nr:protein NosL [Gammaproteobacteria bacterium]
MHTGTRRRAIPLLTAVWLVLLATLGPSACSRGPETGPVEVKWDRDTCHRCGMVLSDRRHAAQVRGGPAGERTRVYLFDDIGGAIVWLQEQPWKNDPRTELWVTDYRNGHWIDGFKATYLSGQRTPMDFGLGAQEGALEGGMSYQQARELVMANEARRRPGGGG